MREDPPPEEVLDLLGDEYARAILTAAGEAPRAARELSEACGMSLPTVYRRVDDLEARGLLVERTRLSPDGHHYTVYEAAFDRLEVDLDDGAFAVEVVPREDAVDRFTRVWEDIRSG